LPAETDSLRSLRHLAYRNRVEVLRIPRVHGLEYGAAADPQTSVPARLRRLKDMAQKYSA